MEDELESEEPWQRATQDRTMWAAIGKGFVQRVLRRHVSTELALGRFFAQR